MRKINKRGNLPIIILVIGVLAVCSLALLSFYVSNFKVSNSFSGIKLVEKVNSQIEEGKSGQIYGDKKVWRPSLFKPSNREIIFSVTYSP